ncbi:class I SAM-dependent methyltransferase [Xanthobacter sp. V4C-4]|uniref:class I SAM-dependent methyltransferase n=1 Tax=Xanthobacter cornucopiae TaxID=3119924 RepID=UPI0037272A47
MAKTPTTSKKKSDPALAGALPCPITGEPPVRRIQTFSKALLQDIWRLGQGVDVSHLLTDVKGFSLYESPTGLVYFDPMVVGDGAFYNAYYDKWEVHDALTHLSDTRVDFMHTAKHVPDGAKVIDIGCGPGVFRRHLPHASYTGLDPYAGPDVDDVVIRETLEAHAAKNPGAYDVACAFHVIEHVQDPLRHAELMARLVRPGGLVVLAAPLFPSPLTEIPNLPVNMPPHHVTWWNPQSFTALAEQLGLEVVEASATPPSPHQNMFFWMHKLLFRRTYHSPDERYFAHRWSWHASIALAYLGARVASRFLSMPSTARPVDAYLVARKP